MASGRGTSGRGVKYDVIFVVQVLLWLQKSGLKKLPSFSQIGEDRPSLQQQLLVFEEFRVETVSLGSQVQELHDSAEQVEAEIKGFRSDLGKKTWSLKTVWDKFLQRVENRGMVLHMAMAFHTHIQQVSGGKGQGSEVK